MARPAVNRIRFDGLADLRAALRRLPTDLAAEAETIVFDAGEAATADIAAGYAGHDVTGTLSGSLALQKTNASRFGAGALVINRAPHAWLFEYGSHGPRFYTGKDKRGRVYTDADRGTMPSTRTFVPPMMLYRERMYDRLRALLRAHGLVPIG